MLEFVQWCTLLRIRGLSTGVEGLARGLRAHLVGLVQDCLLDWPNTIAWYKGVGPICYHGPARGLGGGDQRLGATVDTMIE